MARLSKRSRRAAVLCLLGVLWFSGGIASASNTSDWFELDLRETISQWALSVGLPPDQRDPLDRTGPLSIPNVLAYAMGIDPLAATSRELPRLGPLSSVRDVSAAASAEGEELYLIYQQNTDAVHVDFAIEASTDLGKWEPIKPVSEELLYERDGIEFRAARFPFEDIETIFFRARAEHIE